VNTDPLLWIVAKELHAARKRQRLSQKRLAELAAVSENTVYLIEAAADTRLTTLARLADAADCTLEIKITPRIHNP
jgi:transcriptional regulator with XRE-family HTH domain